jgi:murein tripeptide amidase MpaA
MDGIINYLIGNSEISKFLLENYIFKIVPMLNVDGVIIGNFRCSLAGVDLNRKWHRPNKV